MLKRFIYSNWHWLSYFFIFIFYASIVSGWSIDPLHEGASVATIYGLRYGQIPYKEMFEYKGMGFDFIVNLLLPGNLLSVQGIRIVTIVFTVGSAILSYFILKSYNLFLARILPIVWLLSVPAITNLYSRPWPFSLFIDSNSVIVFFFLVLILCLRQIKGPSKPRHLTLISSLTVFSVSVLPWIRIQAIFFSLSVLAILSFHILKLKRKKENSFFNLPIMVMCSVLGLAAPILYLVINSAFSSWYEQTFLMPQIMRAKRDTMVVWLPGQFIKTFGVYLIMCCAGFLIIALLGILRSRTRNSLIPISLMTVVLFGISLFGLNTEVDSSKNLDLRNWLVLISQWLPALFIYMAIFLTPIVLFKWGLEYCRKLPIFKLSLLQLTLTKRSHASSLPVSTQKKHLPELSLGLAATNSLLFLYPNFGNSWMSSLIPGIFVVASMDSLISKKQEFFDLGLKQTLVLLSSLLLCLWVLACNQPRVSYQNNFLNGISEIDQLRVEKVDAELELLRSAPKNQKFRFLCNYGLLPVSNGSYQSRTYDWGTLTHMRVLPTEDVLGERWIFICDTSLDEIRSYLEHGYRIFARTNLTQKNSFILVK